MESKNSQFPTFFYLRIPRSIPLIAKLLSVYYLHLMYICHKHVSSALVFGDLVVLLYLLATYFRTVN